MIGIHDSFFIIKSITYLTPPSAVCRRSFNNCNQTVNPRYWYFHIGNLQNVWFSFNSRYCKSNRKPISMYEFSIPIKFQYDISCLYNCRNYYERKSIKILQNCNVKINCPITILLKERHTDGIKYVTGLIIKNESCILYTIVQNSRTKITCQLPYSISTNVPQVYTDRY